MKKVLILGIGNILHRDDGIGVYIANRIRETAKDLPEHVEVADGGTAGFDLIPLMQGRDKIVIIDALKADDAPGSIYRFSPEHIRGGQTVMSLHETGISEVLRMLWLLGESPMVEMVGIVPEDVTTLDISISSAVLESVPRAIDVVLDAALHYA